MIFHVSGCLLAHGEKGLSFLYCRVVMPDQAFVISSVRIAYSLPRCTPRSCHSDVDRFTDSDGKEPLMNPVCIIAFFLISL